MRLGGIPRHFVGDNSEIVFDFSNQGYTWTECGMILLKLPVLTCLITFPSKVITKKFNDVIC